MRPTSIRHACLTLLAALLLVVPGCGDDQPGGGGGGGGGGGTGGTSNGGGGNGGSGNGGSGNGGERSTATTVRGDLVQGGMTEAWLKPPEGAEPRIGGTVKVALLGDIDNINPFLSSSATASAVQDMVFARLMEEQPNYYDGVPTFESELAESWVIAEDNLSIRFTLRDVNWSDGKPVVSEDVQFSVQAAKSPEVAWVSASIVDFIDRVEVHDDKQFTVHYSKAQPYNIMDINDVSILPKHAFGAIPFARWQGYPDWMDIAKATCSGPFRVENHVAGQKIELVRNDAYYDAPKPYLDRVELLIYKDSQAALGAVRANEVDVLGGVPPKDADKVLDDEDLYLYSYVTRAYLYCGWNTKRAPFDDKRVRQAMTHAINRENIVEASYLGYADVATPLHHPLDVGQQARPGALALRSHAGDRASPGGRLGAQ